MHNAEVTVTDILDGTKQKMEVDRNNLTFIIVKDIWISYANKLICNYNCILTDIIVYTDEGS